MDNVNAVAKVSLSCVHHCYMKFVSPLYSANSAHGEVYLIQQYVINLVVTCGMSVDFSEYSGFLHQ